MKVLSEALVALWNTKWLFGAVVALFSTVLALLLSSSSFYEKLELKSYDTRFALRGRMETEQDSIVIVAIDDKSFAALRTRWPFPRALFAKAVLNLYHAGAKLIILDIEFPYADTVDTRQDRLLTRAISGVGNVILSGKLTSEFRPDRRLVSRLSPPMTPLLEGGTKWGLINVHEDPDGFIRRYVLFLADGGKKYYSLSVQAFVALKEGYSANGRERVDENGYFWIADRRIPMIDENAMLTNFRGPARSFPTYSFSAVLDDKGFALSGTEDKNIFESHKLLGTFRNKIVFIGASSERLRDNKLTPFFNYKRVERRLPGVELHANALSTLLRGDFLRVQSRTGMVLTSFLLAALAMLTAKLLKPWRAALAIVGLVAAFIIFSLYAFLNNCTWIAITTPLTALFISFAGNVTHEITTLQKARIKLKQVWQHSVPATVFDEMLESGETPHLAGERREVSVLFSDIRDFTAFSQRHSSQEVVQRLNQYLTAMVQVVHRHSGTLDKFVGDEIMAFFGAPHAHRNHAEKACLTALDMVEKLRALQKSWSEQNLDYFQIGIGINTGKVVLGNLGSAQLFDYTIVGDDVNLGAYLQAANKRYGTTVLISEYTYKSVRRKAQVREVDLVKVKGKDQPVRVFELRGMAPLPPIEQDLLINVYLEGLAHYKARKWYHALIEFKRILRYFPTDGPTRVYIKRCLNFIENPPQDTWDGVFEANSRKELHASVL